MIVSDRIIDARERFGAGPGSRVGKTSTPAIDAEQSAERSRRKAAEAGELRTYLAATPRLEVTDRKVLARNLGRAIERRHREERKQVCGRLFRELYGEDGGLSREKKRKRYIRFDDESLDDHEKGNEYAANGPEFLRLIDGLAGLLEPDSAVVMAREQMLLRVCDGAAFSGSARPRLHQDQGSWQAFQSTMAALLDRMARKTDLIEYLSEVQHYDIRTYPRYRNDYSPEIISKVSEQFLPITRFSTAPDPDEFGTDDYTRLSLDGFDIHGEGSSELYPRIRLARLYWPRQVLCLPASVPTATLSEIFTRPLSDAEFAEALDAAEIPEWVDPAKRAQWATREWKAQKVHELWVGALREAGYDPASIDWWSFEEEGHRNALHGAKWHTIWQTANVNLHIVADGQPEVLQLGVSFDGVAYCGWAQGHKTLLDPNDDVIPGEEINGFMWIDLTDKDSPFFEQRDQSLVCRGLSHYSAGDDNNDEIDDQFDSHSHPEMGKLTSKPVWPLLEVWDILTRRMDDWKKCFGGIPTDIRLDERRPGLRILFDAPAGWTPAPDDTIASAMLRSLAYGTGTERLDDKLIAAINERVHCLDEMKNTESRRFEEGMTEHGYGHRPAT